MKPQRTKDGVPNPKIPKGWRILAPQVRLVSLDCWFDFDDGKWWELWNPAVAARRTASDYGLVIRKLSKEK